jgi:predicted Zn-dependent peptidase
MAIDVVSDLITSSVVTALDVDAERKVVLEEIAMRDDDPSDLVHDLYAETYYGDTPLGRPILGTIDSIKSMSRNAVFNYYKKRYLPQDLVVAVAGNIKHKKVVAMVEAALSKDDFLDVMGAPVIRPSTSVKKSAQQSVGLITRPTEQAHMFYGMEGVARHDDRRFAMGILASALGGGMSSRLFQEIREKRGLAYSVYAYAQQFAGSGQIGFYAGCNPAKAIEVVEIIREVLADVADNGMSHEEIERAKGAVRGSLVLSQEDSGSRMSRIGKNEIVYGHIMGFDEINREVLADVADNGMSHEEIERAKGAVRVSLVLSQEDSGSRMSRIGKNEIVYGHIMGFDEILKAISAVNSTDIKEIASDFLTKTPTLALVGPFKSESKFEKVLSA